MAKRDFTAAASPNTRVSQYVLRDRISRYFRLLQRHYLSIPGNEKSAVFEFSAEEHIDRAASTLKYSIDAPRHFLDITAEFTEGKRPVITFTQSVDGDKKEKKITIEDPRSMAAIKGPVENFLQAQIKGLSKEAINLESQAQSIRQFMSAINGPAAGKVRPAVV
ncbi:MAG TPA: hypothetical protein VIN59_00440 [Alphaproteobacteria bacterium]